MYCDTSALLKSFVNEPGSDDINSLLVGRDDVLVSELAITELVSALSRRVREGTVTRGIAGQIYRSVVRRLDATIGPRLDLTPGVHRHAENLMMTLGDVPLRAADALHLALATLAGARSLVSFDSRLSTAARAAGLAVYP